MRILSIANQTNFKHIFHDKPFNYSNRQREIMADIETKATTPNEKYQNSTPDSWLENKGYDIHLKSGENDSVQVALESWYIPDGYIRYEVGEYSDSNFNSNAFKNCIRKNTILRWVPTMLAAFAIAAGMICNSLQNKKTAVTTKTHITSDTVSHTVGKVAAPFKKIVK